MNAPSQPWQSSPHASEFLPEEIERLERGSMILCEECLWPRSTDAACDKCATYNVDQDRDDRSDFADLP